MTSFLTKTTFAEDSNDIRYIVRKLEDDKNRRFLTIRIDKQTKHVDYYNYLSFMIASDGSRETEIKTRIKQGK